MRVSIYRGARPAAKTLGRLLAIAALVAVSGPAVGSETLETVRERGLLKCGVTASGDGLSHIDAEGRRTGFFPEMCRALAAAIFADADAVTFVETDFVTRFDALADDAFDVLMSTTTWTSGRDAGLGLAFTHTLIYDEQGFLAHRSLGATQLDELGPTTVCVHENTTTIDNLRDLVDRRFPDFTVLPFRSPEMGYEAFFARECDVLTQDRLALMAQRLVWADDPEDYVLFPDVIAREPLGPVVRQGDPGWFDLVQWAMFALIVAEAHGIDSTNVDAALTTTHPEVARLLGVEGSVGAELGVAPDWAYQAIRQVGSYGEVFDRTLGRAIGIDRGLNDLWTRGGLLYAPPFR